jgi:hypothetical protein
MAKNRIGFTTDFNLIDSKVGIGTTNPLQSLHIRGNLLVAAGSSTGQHITQNAYELNSGTLSWEGSAGQLFSITNNLTSGSIFSVNDVSGIPSIDVDADGTIQLGPYGGNIGIGTINPTAKLDVAGDVRVTGGINVTGVSTFSGGIQGNVTGNVNSSGVSTFSSVNVTGNVSIGGTLTYDDVTNVDSIGLVTARSGVRIDAGGLVVTAGISTFTTGPVIIGAATSTGTASQPLQVTGGAYVSGNLGIGKTIPEHTVDIRGDLRADAVSAGNFNIGITSSVYVSVTAGIGTNISQTRNIFTGPGIAYSFPSTVSRTYVIESIHITNKSGNELYITGRHDYDGGSNVPIANRVIVPYQGSVELLEQPTVANPEDIIRLQALTSQGTDAEGHNGGIDAFIVISEKQVNDFIGTGATITSADQEVFKTVTKSSVIQSVRLTNYDNNIDVDASVSVFRNASAVGGGVRLGYLAFNLTVPKNSVVEIIQNPKYLQSDDAIKVSASSSNTLAVTVAGKYIK